MAEFVPTHIQDALEVLATERERTTAEREAFSTFHDRIEALDASPARSADAPTQQRDAPLGLKPPPNKSLQRARKTYRETVMSVPHYEAEYDDSLVENLAAEFDPAVARAMTTDDSFTPQLRERLLAESQQAHDDHATLLTIIEQECDAVRTARETLTAAADLDILTARSLHSWSSEELAEAREMVADAEQHCNALARERQRILHTDRVPGPRHTEIPLHAYFYQSLSVTHPVLADIAELGETLRTARDHIDRVRDEGNRNRRRVDSRLL